MKKYKTTIATVLAVALIVPAMTLISVPQAEAACSYNGYINSGGKCDKSSKYEYRNWYWENKDDDRDVHQFNWSSQRSGSFSGFGGFNFGGNYSEHHYQQIMRLLALLTQLQELMEQRDSFYDFDGNSEIDITTLTARDIEKDEARLRGEVDFNDSDEATVWFEYGTNPSRLTSRTDKVNWDDSDDEDFDEVVDDLRDDTRYYFRAVGEDEDGVVDRGVQLSFWTLDENEDDENDEDPDIDTERADVEDDSVELNGSIDMNDFDSGRVFFVYGTDEDQVRDIEDYDTYSEIDEDGDDLQKVQLDNDLDGNGNYTYFVDGLEEDTKYYFSMCVEYEDEDGDDTIVCSDVEEFETED